MYVNSGRAAAFVGVCTECLWRWAKNGCTSYELPLRTVRYGKHLLVDERDVVVAAMVNRDFPLTRAGPGRRDRREQMKSYALRLRAKLDPTP